MDDSIKKILEIVTDTQEQMEQMREQMATKDDIRNLQAQTTENTRAIEDLTEKLDSVFGYAKEIDMLISRVSVLEKTH